jgi:diguanylate cyclase (GGDEF)-like protein
MEQIIRELFLERTLEEKDLLGKLDRLAEESGDRVYQEVFRFLLRKDVDISQAGRFWREALARWGSMDKVTPAHLRIRAALLDYLHHVVGDKLNSPNDGLTGLYNWNFAKSYAENLLAYMRRSKNSSSLSLVLLNLDHFRRYNLHCGPMQGDRALRHVAEILRGRIREMDIASRHDGGDFALFLPGSNRIQAFEVAERIRAAVETASFAGQDILSGGKLTISCGIASFPRDGDGVHALMREAGRELAAAKKKRNCISPARPKELRDHRRKVSSLVEFALADAYFSTGMAMNISRTGIAIGCDCDLLSPGLSVTLRFRRPFWPKEREVSAVVRRVWRTSPCAMLQAGLEFSAPEHDLCKPIALSA